MRKRTVKWYPDRRGMSEPLVIAGAAGILATLLSVLILLGVAAGKHEAQCAACTCGAHDD